MMMDLENLQFDDAGTTFAPPAKPKGASIPSLEYFRGLINQRDFSTMLTGMKTEDVQLMTNLVVDIHTHDGVQHAFDTGDFAQKKVSEFITQLKNMPKTAQKRPEKNELPDGIYFKNGTFYKVYWNQVGSRQLVKRLVIDRPGVGDQPAVSHWHYVGALTGFLTEADKYNPTMQEAMEFGPIYGRCGICGRVLSNELSIALAIGPVCGDREFGGEFQIMLRAVKERLGL